MPQSIDNRFLRQQKATQEQIGIVIPQNALLKPEIRSKITGIVNEDSSVPTSPPHKFSFHYINWPVDNRLLEDDATIDNGVYEFYFRDAVIGVFDLPAFQDDEFCWSFSSTCQIYVVVALKIGETFDVSFDEELVDAYHITKYHFPSGVPNSGYGEYAIHLTIDGLNTKGFRIVSSFEPQSKQTKSRLPFFFGFRVFGKSKGDEEYPI